MNFWEASLVFFGMVFSVGALAIFLEHLQKTATIKAMARGQQHQDIQRKLEELAQQIAEIRQMHADHVLGVDSHIQHLEYKLSALENRIEQMEQQTLHR
ncbi:MAG: hypothetical protein KatS3mg023_2486 [Armatimonadota bacterium]|nr:MAG: hypothetical protein KatS3mg023_2486 [Armatimonadota bacterium]